MRVPFPSGVFALPVEICNKGKTIVIVTHDEKIARQCDRILCMKDGKI